MISIEKLVMNVVKRRYCFHVYYKNGKIEDMTVEAESADAARLLLPEDIYRAIRFEEK